MSHGDTRITKRFLSVLSVLVGEKFKMNLNIEIEFPTETQRS